MRLYQKTQTGSLSGTPLSFAYIPLVDSCGVIPPNEVERLLRNYLVAVSHDITIESRFDE